MAGPGKLEARAVHGDLPLAVIGVQDDAGQGPCLDAVATAAQIRVSDTKTEDRWPLLGRRVAALRTLSMICTPLPASARVRGSLTLQPPPDHHGGSDLARVHQSGPALPGAVHADAQIEVTGRWPGYMPGPAQRRQASR
jgi:hypothetical protein